MERIRCITFDKEAQDALPEHIKAKMKANMDKSKNESFCQKCCGLSASYCEKAKLDKCIYLMEFKQLK